MIWLLMLASFIVGVMGGFVVAIMTICGDMVTHIPPSRGCGRNDTW